MWWFNVAVKLTREQLKYLWHDTHGMVPYPQLPVSTQFSGIFFCPSSLWTLVTQPHTILQTPNNPVYFVFVIIANSEHAKESKTLAIERIDHIIIKWNNFTTFFQLQSKSFFYCIVLLPSLPYHYTSKLLKMPSNSRTCYYPVIKCKFY